MAVVVLLTAAVVTVLWWAGTRGLTGKDLVTARLDALRVGLSICVGGGGVFALYLAWRRQRSTEADLDNRERALSHQLQVAADTQTHQERVAAATETDAAARRVTDLYTKAVEQLGSEKAPVRLGGLYALERLAQDHLEQRQTIVNVLCAYLRMPCALPGYPPAVDANAKVLTKYRERVQEREVRLAAQRILAHHLRPGDDPDNPVKTFWVDINLDLTGATLIDLNLNRCTTRHASFTQATFVGVAGFHRTVFTGNTEFSRVTFTHDARFDNATFTDDARFDNATFTDDALFNWATFTSITRFNEATFGASAEFNEATFSASAEFNEATFGASAEFDRVSFDGNTAFYQATFSAAAWFGDATFSTDATFNSASFTGNASFRSATFTGDVTFRGAALPSTPYTGTDTPRPWTDFTRARFERAVPLEVEWFVLPPDDTAGDGGSRRGTG